MIFSESSSSSSSSSSPYSISLTRVSGTDSKVVAGVLFSGTMDDEALSLGGGGGIGFDAGGGISFGGGGGIPSDGCCTKFFKVGIMLPLITGWTEFFRGWILETSLAPISGGK